jgi:rhodanese-related sulfurtransferase
MTEPVDISPTEFRERWPNPSLDGAVLLDVREPDERTAASIDDALTIPMNEIPARIGELPKHQPIVVMCHGGMRSLRVAQFLKSKGFEQVFNLAGGIDAWSREVDPSITRY